MFTRFILTVVLLSVASLHRTAAQDTTGALSDTQARAIVEQEMAAKEAARLEKLRQLNAAPVIERSLTNARDHKIIVNRVVPPVPAVPERAEAAPALAAIPPVQESQPSPGTSEMDLSEVQVRNRFIALSATIYDDRISELRWSHEGTQYCVFSNLNFKFLQGIGQFEVNNCLYSFFMAFGEETTESLRSREQITGGEPQWIPTPTDFSSTAPEYLIVSPTPPQPSDEDAFADMDMLHRYLVEHMEELKIAYQRAEALHKAHEAYLLEHPPVPRDTIINHWR